MQNHVENNVKYSTRDNMRNTAKSETSIKKGRSRITNGRSMFPRTVDGQSIDMRGRWTRRLRDLVASYTSDAGGADNISEGMRSIIHRIASLQTQLERIESQWAIDDGEATPASLELYQRTANSQRRLIETAGLKTRSMKTVPDIKDYMKQMTRQRITLEHED